MDKKGGLRRGEVSSLKKNSDKSPGKREKMKVRRSL